MTTWFMMAAAAPGDKSIPQQIAETFGWNGTLFASQVISFLVVAFLLNKFAYKPILKVLEDRRQKIADGLAAADKTKAELANTQAKVQEIIAQAGQQANKIIEEARAAAAAVGEQERQKAVADAQSILTKAREAGDAELARLQGELRKEFARLVVQAAARSTADVLTNDQKIRIADDSVRQLAA